MTTFLRSVWFRAGLTVAILAVLGTRIDMRASGEALFAVDLRCLLLALVLVGLDRATMILRWVVLLKASGHQVSVKSAAWIHMVSSFVGSVLPAGVGADATRAYTLSRRTAQTSEAVASVAVDRVVGVISIATMGAIGLSIWSSTDSTAPQGLAVPVAIGTLTLGICTLRADWLTGWLLPTPWHSSRVGAAILNLARVIAGYRERPATLVLVFLLSMTVQALRILEAYVLGLGLGINVDLAYYLVFMPVGLLALLMPISVGGFGLPQGVFVWLLRPRGVPDPTSFALSTLIILTGLAGTLPGAFLYARSKKT